jgi:hypothetical protein
MLRHFFETAGDSLDLSTVTRAVSSVLHCLRVTRTPFHQTFRLVRVFEEEITFANLTEELDGMEQTWKFRKTLKKSMNDSSILQWVYFACELQVSLNV